MSWLVFLEEELGLIIVLGDQIDPLVCSVDLHEALDAEILVQNARYDPKLSLDLLSSLTGQVGLCQDLFKHLAFPLYIVRFQCLFKRIQFHKVLALYLMIIEKVWRLR